MVPKQRCIGVRLKVARMLEVQFVQTTMPTFLQLHQEDVENGLRLHGIVIHRSSRMEFARQAMVMRLLRTKRLVPPSVMLVHRARCLGNCGDEIRSVRVVSCGNCRCSNLPLNKTSIVVDSGTWKTYIG